MIELRNVSLYRGRRAILQGIDLEVQAGELLAVLGPNGAGKSTLLAGLSGELRQRQGEILLDGSPLQSLRPGERAKRLALLPQESHLSFSFTAAEVVAMGRIPHPPDPAEDARIVRESLHAAGVAHLAARQVPTLSGGERQLVQLARVLAQLASAPKQRRCLLLDEPTSSLDLEHQHQVLRLARRLASEGAAVVAILHDLNLAARYADRLLLLGRSGVVGLGSPWEALTESAIEEVFRLKATVRPSPVGDHPLVLAG